MIPAWKLKRELTRVGKQMVGLPSTLMAVPARLKEPARRRAHDAAFPDNLEITDGILTPGRKLAVFVLFQPNGIAASTFEMCHALVLAGYAPLVVSNAPLSPDDKDRLTQVCWQIVDRPNFGYDFGAYRDGLRLIRQAGIHPDYVILLNDSFWCDLTSDIFKQLETSDADLAGLLQDEKVKHDTQGGVPTEKYHIESYFLFVTRQLWNHPAFIEFWKNYPLTQYKPNTIKYGEIGFSLSMSHAGLDLTALTQRSVFLAEIAQKTSEDLRQFIIYGAYDERMFRKDADQLLAQFSDDDTWRDAAINHIRRWVNRRRFNAAFPLASHQVFGMSFVKKSNEPIFEAARKAYLRAVFDGLIPPPSQAILTEIAASTDQTIPPAILKACN